MEQHLNLAACGGVGHARADDLIVDYFDGVEAESTRDDLLVDIRVVDARDIHHDGLLMRKLAPSPSKVLCRYHMRCVWRRCLLLDRSRCCRLRRLSRSWSAEDVTKDVCRRLLLLLRLSGTSHV